MRLALDILWNAIEGIVIVLVVAGLAGRWP